MKSSKTRNIKMLRGRKPMYKLLLRQRRRILNLLQQNNDQDDNNMPVDNPQNALIDNYSPSVSPALHNSCIDQMSNVHQQCSQLSSVVTNECSQLSSIVNKQCSQFFSDVAMNVDNYNFYSKKKNISPESDCNFNAEINTSHVFQESLAEAFIQGNLTHTQGNIILKTLRSLPCFSYLPKDSRTLLQTPRKGPSITKIEPGEYLHIGFAKALIRILQKTLPNLIPDVLQVDWSTDGARLNKSGNMQIWPIQCSVANIANSTPEVVGIYKGPKKPYSIDLFLNQFIEDVLQVIDNGVFFLQKQIPIMLRAFIADAPVRSWILNHFGHTSSNPCSKCKVVGTRYKDQMVFIGTNHHLRTDDEYAQFIDEDHHKGPSPLNRLSMGMVSQVPIEYMHLICIGVVKKLLTAWVTGKYGKKMKLSGRNQNLISKRLQHLTSYCPREFARKPRSLADYKDYKATEGRQFVLYTGSIVLLNIMEQHGYMHFLLLHAAVRALCRPAISQTLLLFAKLALETFVKKCLDFYEHTFLSYNVHALLHLTKDVERLGPLDSFSAFPYENNISFFRKYYRKPHRPLQQFFYRQTEREIREKLEPVTDDKIKFFGKHNEGPLPLKLLVDISQYKKLQNKMDTRVKKIIQKRPRKHINFILNTQRTGQSKRLGHPSRPIIRPKKYITTSSSDKEKSIKRIRTDKSNRSEQTTDIENHIDQIRKDLSNDKENEPDNAFTENASPAIFNTSSPQLLNPASQMESLPNVIYEQYSGSNNSMRQKTYTELLTRNSSSNFNVNTTENTSFPCSTSYMYDSHINNNNRISYEKSVPTTSFYESPQTQRHEAHHYQEEPSRLISTCERNNLDRSHVGYKLDQNQARCNLVQSQAEYNFGQSQTGSRSRDREVGCQYEKLNNVVSKEDFQFLREEMNKYYQTINEKLDKLLRKRINNIMPPKPSVFPLQSVQQVEDFNNISEEKYENAVEYLHFVGGFTLHDAIKHCMREAITDDAIQYYSAWGERGNRPLFETKIIKAIYDAVCRNAHFKKPLRDEFFREVGEAVRFGKQRNRNVMKRMNERERGQRQRLRREADNNLFGEVEDNTHNDNEIDDANDGDPESN